MEIFQFIGGIFIEFFKILNYPLIAGLSIFNMTISAALIIIVTDVLSGVWSHNVHVTNKKHQKKKREAK